MEEYTPEVGQVHSDYQEGGGPHNLNLDRLCSPRVLLLIHFWAEIQDRPRAKDA